MWDNHDYDEDGGGQRLKWAYSDNFGDTWTSAMELFPRHDNIQARLSGRLMLPIGWVVISGELYALADILDSPLLSTGFVGTLCRKVNSDGTLGTIHWVQISGGGTSVTPKSGYPSYSYDNTNWTAIVSYLTTQGRRASSGYSALSQLQTKLDHATNSYTASGGLIEQSELRMPYGSYFRIWRAFSAATLNDCYWTQYSRDGVTYFYPSTSDIPYPVSVGTVRQVALNKIALVGNPKNTGSIDRNPLIIAICGPDLIFKPQNIYTIRTCSDEHRFPGASKHGMISYPTFIMMSNGRIGCSYTTFGKEDIEFSSFILPDYIP